MGLRLRLNLLLTAIFLAGLVVSVVLLLGNARAAVTEELRASSDLAATLIQGLRAPSGSAHATDSLVELIDLLDDHAPLRHLRITLAADDITRTAALGEHASAPTAVPAWFFHFARPAPDLLNQTIDFERGRILIVADPSAEIIESWGEVRVTLLVLVTVFLGANVLVSLVLGRALRPLAKLSQALEEVQQGHYSARLASTGIADIDRLSGRFNEMSAALESSERENAALAQRSLAIQEQERRFLAQELHDEMGQSITAIKALAVSIRERADSVLGARATTIIEVSSAIYTRVREMMTRLHPAMLDELGLVAALEQMVDEWNTHHGDCFCRLHVNRHLGDVDAAVSIGVYRIVQEAMTNIARHAQASAAEVVVRVVTGKPSILYLSVVDNGRGFDPDVSPRGLGLRGIHERVQALGGRVNIATSPPTGTRIEVAIPFKNPAEEQHPDE